MVNKEDLIEELHQSTHKLLGHLSTFTETEFNFHPAPGKWSAADIAEHLLIIETRIQGALRGLLSPTERAPEDKLALFKPALQDRSQTIQAPDAVMPTGAIKDKKKILDALEEQRNKLTLALQTTDLDLTCMDFSHPRLGKLTVVEWVWFNIYHAQRHIHQLEELKRSIGASM